MIELVTLISERVDRKTILHKTLVQCSACMRVKILANIVALDKLNDHHCMWCDGCRVCKKAELVGNHYNGSLESGYHKFILERRSK